MWCNTCQQETPGAIHPASARIVCSRCQQPMERRKPPHAARICDEGLALDEPATSAAGAAAKNASFRVDDWAARQRVRSVVRELRRPNPASAVSPNRAATDRLRLDPPHNWKSPLEHTHLPGISPAAAPPSANPILQRNGLGNQFAAWLIVFAGVLTLASGVGLIAWSLSKNEMRFWNLALGLALGGQGALIFGLVLVISRLWRTSRYAAARLQDVHARLGQLQQASETLAASNKASAPAFYADLVRGASPHVLLANIKGQVDQLATHVSGGW
jgi:hypothetical protein